ncbi:MAG: BREX-2 system phosphatase PglZ, partial [Planctomycetes bacterium]|nr:BREX-2 system phosphatase PglZ [Planctomycetota bacterium]
RAKSGSRPRLFHKTGLLPKAETDIDPEVRDAIASPRLRVVGTVVNAVDDHLHGSDQLDVRWTREAVKPLATLLYEARVSGRAVVVVGDHGHVIEYESEARGGEAAQRWRADDGRPGAGEVAVAGPRVVVPSSGRLIAPWSEKLRYGSKQSGYHGGASPQEAVVPLVVLKAGDLEVTGWAEAPAFEPEWWREPAAERAPWSAVAPELPRRKAAPAGTGQREFEFIEPPAAARPAAGGAGAEPAGWIDGLLGSKVFAQQKKLGGRGAPSDSQLRKLLEVFAEHGRKVLSSALAQKLGVPAFRMPGLIAAFQRLLNVEGYPVLIRDDASDTVELSQELLVRQFGLE